MFQLTCKQSDYCNYRQKRNRNETGDSLKISLNPLLFSVHAR